VIVLLPFLAALVVVTVRVAVPLPPAMDGALRMGVTPGFAPLTVRFTVDVKLFTGETVTVNFTLFPLVTVCELGEMLRLKLGTGGGLITREVVAMWLSEPLWAVTVSGYVPAAMPATVLTVKVPLLPTADAVAPDGTPATAS
jgi:hypothetical protein